MAAGLPVSFRYAVRVSSPPFGSTVNAPAGRPPGPQPSNTRGLRLENAGAFPTPPQPKVYQQQHLFEICSYGYGGASLAALATPLDGTQASLLSPIKLSLKYQDDPTWPPSPGSAPASQKSASEALRTS